MARYKVLKSVAHSVGHSFTSLLNYRGDDYVMGHLLRRARAVDADELVVDLMSGDATPASLLTKDVKASVRAYCEWFPKLVAAHRTEMQYIRRARMSIRFDLGKRRAVRHAPTCVESPYTCRVELEDDRGKVWAAELKDWWYPEEVDPAGKKSTFRERLGQIIRTIWSPPSASMRLQPHER